MMGAPEKAHSRPNSNLFEVIDYSYGDKIVRMTRSIKVGLHIFSAQLGTGVSEFDAVSDAIKAVKNARADLDTLRKELFELGFWLQSQKGNTTE